MILKSFAGVALSLFLFSGIAFASEGEQVHNNVVSILDEGTIIPVESVETISSKNCRKGQKIFFKSKNDIKADGKIVISADTLVKATVIKAKHRGPWGSSGEIDLVFSEIKAKNGQLIPVVGKLDVKGKKPNFFVKYSLLGVLISGQNVNIKRGLVVDLKVANNIIYSELKENVIKDTAKSKVANKK